MGFNIKFYKISDAPNVLNKNVKPEEGNVGTKAGYNCTPWEPVGVLDGSVVIDYVQDIGTANYAYISGGTRPRYAYVTGFEILPGHQMRVYVKEDALMTFKTEIKESDILATRCSVNARDDGNVGYNSYLNDPMWRCDSTTLYFLSDDLMRGQFNYDIHDSENRAEYIIVTAG
jgi:hypothetical protein